MLQGHAKRAKTEHLSNVGPSLLMRSTTYVVFFMTFSIVKVAIRERKYLVRRLLLCEQIILSVPHS